MWHVDFHDSPEDLTLAVRGNLDTAATREFEPLVDAHLQTLSKPIVVDLEGLEYLNSTGLRTFIRLERIARVQGQEVRFLGASDRVRRIFEYCGLDHYFSFTPAVDSRPLA